MAGSRPIGRANPARNKMVTGRGSNGALFDVVRTLGLLCGSVCVPNGRETIDTRNKVRRPVHISIRSNPKGNSIAADVPYGHLQYSPRAIVLQRPSMYALARLPMTFTFILTRCSNGFLNSGRRLNAFAVPA